MILTTLNISLKMYQYVSYYDTDCFPFVTFELWTQSFKGI
jgi:hypothetical protein